MGSNLPEDTSSRRSCASDRKLVGRGCCNLRYSTVALLNVYSCRRNKCQSPLLFHSGAEASCPNSVCLAYCSWPVDLACLPKAQHVIQFSAVERDRWKEQISKSAEKQSTKFSIKQETYLRFQMAGWAILRFAVGMYLALQSRIAHSMRMEHLHRVTRLSSRSALQTCRQDSFEAPEAATSIQVLCHLGGRCVPATVDTAAQVSVMSAECVRRLRLSQYVDARYNGKAVGVGTQDITGEIRNLPIRIGSAVVFPRIAVLKSRRRVTESDQPDETMPDFLIGMDVLRRHKAEILLSTQTLKLHTTNGRTHVIPLLDKAAASTFQQEEDDGEQDTSLRSHESPSQTKSPVIETVGSTRRHRPVGATGSMEQQYHPEEEYHLMPEEMAVEEEQVSLEGF